MLSLLVNCLDLVIITNDGDRDVVFSIFSTQFDGAVCLDDVMAASLIVGVRKHIVTSLPDATCPGIDAWFELTEGSKTTLRKAYG